LHAHHSCKKAGLDDWIAGRATFTTVLSMNAMLDPRMVAVSIQIFASAPHGTPSSADRIMASSQGVFMQAIDAVWVGSLPNKLTVIPLIAC